MCFVEDSTYSGSINSASSRPTTIDRRFTLMQNHKDNSEDIYVCITCNDENIKSTILKMSRDSTVNDLFKRFKGKIKHLNPKQYFFKELRSKEMKTMAGFENLNKPKLLTGEADLPLNEDMKLTHQKNPYLELVKKKYFDSPKRKKSEKIRVLQQNSINEQAQNAELYRIEEELYEDYHEEAYHEDSEACKYEVSKFFIKKQVFEVVKTNERGKKQNRLQGIDAIKLYNMSIKKEGGVLNNFWGKLTNQNASGTTMRKTRLIDDVLSWKWNKEKP